jgi:peptidoglycan hydrolase-like protein with peptidoglycan-binding domain
MTVFNAFFGHGSAGRGGDVLASGSTTTKSDATQRTLILKYDETVEDVQRELLAAGLFLGLVDGVDGPQTKVAVENYQRANQLEATGVVSPTLLEHIRYTKKLAQAAKFTGSTSPIVEPAVQKPVVPHPILKPAAAAQEVGGFVELQTRLAKLGYDPGTRSGLLDEATKSAILIFEMDHGLAMQGKVSKAFLNALKQAESKISSNN